MINLLFRFIFVYFFMVLSMKLMGKRQAGQLQMSELVTAFFLSELAAYVVTDPKVPLLFGLIPILFIICIEVIVSFFTVKSPILKRVFDFAPSVLIQNGKILENELLSNRMTLDELLSQLRLSGYQDISCIRFAILEPNGQVSVVPFQNKEAVVREDLGISVPDDGYTVALIDDGIINQKALTAISKSEAWLRDEMRKRKIYDPKEVFLLAANFNSVTTVILKEKE